VAKTELGFGAFGGFSFGYFSLARQRKVTNKDNKKGKAAYQPLSLLNILKN
jgi:hypothetical protein